MKQKLDISRLLAFILLGASLLLFASTTNGLEIKRIEEISPHISRLHSLYLGKNSYVGIISEDGRLNITNGLVVGNSSAASTMATIGGGLDNKILANSEGAGIAGGQQNKILGGRNSVIGGGLLNTINGDNAVIVGGEYNTGSTEGAVVVGGKGNVSNGGVVFGGSGNQANGINSLVMGEGAKGNMGSFAWNGEADNYSARIDAANGILIGTYDIIDGVSLVVNGAIKIGGGTGTNGVAGEIRMVSGCFYAYDGSYWHVINQSTTGCNALPVAKTCRFGNVQLQAGDRVTAYKVNISSNCDAEKSDNAVCNSSGDVTDGSVSYPYPYCYSISS